MTINKLTALEQGNAANSNGGDVAASVNALIDLHANATTVDVTGITDPTALIQAAINTNDLIVIVNNGDFVEVERMQIPSNKTVLGRGLPKLRLKGQDWGDTTLETVYIFLFDYATEGSTVSGFILDGNKANVTGTEDAFIEAINLKGKRNEISRNIIMNAKSEGVDIDGNGQEQYNRILFNYIIDCGGVGVHNSTGSNSNIITHNTVKTCGIDRLRAGIDSFGTGVSDSIGGHVISNNILDGNYRNLSIEGTNTSAAESNISVNGTLPDLLTKKQLSVPSAGEVGSYNIMSKKTGGSVAVGDELTGADIFSSNTTGSQLNSVSVSETWKALAKSSGTGGALADRQALYIRIS